MTEEELVKKWLAQELSEEEQQRFDALKDSEDFKRIVSAAQNFAKPTSETPYTFKEFKDKASVQRPKTNLWYLRIASILLLAFSIYMLWFYPSSIVKEAKFAENESFSLPDNSEVVLNAGSRLTFNEDAWPDQRILELDGEAYFSVTSGKTFSVQTKMGTITVVGTQFNVAFRNSFLEVTCYEGKVRVEFDEFSKILNPGERVVKLFDEVRLQNVDDISPDWRDGMSKFDNVPFNMVCDELERQFNVDLQLEDIDESRKFNGAFPNNNLENALSAITKPMNLGFTIRSNRVVIHAEHN